MTSGTASRFVSITTRIPSLSDSSRDYFSHSHSWFMLNPFRPNISTMVLNSISSRHGSPRTTCSPLLPNTTTLQGQISKPAITLNMSTTSTLKRTRSTMS